MIEEIHVESWIDLQNKIFEGFWNEKLKRYRSTYVFRGLPKSGYKLETTLMRLGGDYTKLERHLFRNFKKYAHRDIVERDTDWHWLAMAQHHGLPTRLLDWTFSPYVAMHFCTEKLEHFGEDGAIWVADNVMVHSHLPYALAQVLEANEAEGFSVDLLSDVVEPFLGLDKFFGQKDFMLFFDPPSIDDRIINQFALFSIMSNPALSADEWFIRYPERLCKKLIVPAELKWEIRDKLDQSNITERVLFPGLDGLSSWLKRHYSPKE